MRVLGPLGKAGVAAQPMIVVPEEFRFIQGKVTRFASDEDVAHQGPTICLELLACTEEMRVIRHVEHGHEVNAPWLRLGRSLLDQDRDTAVDRHGDLGVAARAEDGAGTCVGVEESNIGSGEYEAAVIFLQLLRVHQQEGEQGLQDRSLWSCERQEAEPEAPVAYSRKDVLTI